jgi:hypothetical protein
VPGIVIVLVEPVPVAVTPAPTKLIVAAAVAKDEPSSCTVIAEPPLLTVVNVNPPLPSVVST